MFPVKERQNPPWESLPRATRVARLQEPWDGATKATDQSLKKLAPQGLPFELWALQEQVYLHWALTWF